MNWISRYVPPDPIIWDGRADIPPESCFYQQVRLLNLMAAEPAKTAPITFALIGFKCDEGIQRDLGRAGAFEGPTAIRQSLGKLPLQKTAIHFYDVGNVICTDHDLEASQHALAEIIANLLEKDIHPIVIGGGHELAWGVYQGLTLAFPPNKKLGIINFDAHFDLQPTIANRNGSATTCFYQIAEAHKLAKRRLDYNCIGIQHAGNIRQTFDIAKKYQTHVIFADELHQGLHEKCFDLVDRVADENDIIYLSLSLNVFSPAFAPGVSTIQPLGLVPWHIIPYLRQAAATSKVVCYDISELVPRYDIDHRTAKLAATLIYEIIHHHTAIHRLG